MQLRDAFAYFTMGTTRALDGLHFRHFSLC